MIKLVLLLLLIAAIVAIKLLPWWASVAGVLGLLFALKLFGGRMLEAIFSAPFRAKSKVLEGAEVEINSVEDVERPRRADDDEEDEGEGDEEGWPGKIVRYVAVDLRLTPRPTDGPFGLWEPGELALAPPRASGRLDDDEDGCLLVVGKVELHEDEGFVEWSGDKLEGAQRVRLTFGVPASCPKDLRFTYYFAQFGSIELVKNLL